jgi:2-polyprenyl-3-methyl-5-hydroxy-6-metoxy-1,4-benzoquinol methylase
MSTTSAPPAPAATPWKTCLDIENQDARHYLDNVNLPLIDMFDGAPRRVLELGCATGRFGEVLKERFGNVSVVGIDANRAAAELAANLLDRVICARIEDLDFAAQGFAEQEFDAVIVADILEHLTNPWRLLERLRPFIAPDGQLLASIPNARNLTLLSQLADAGRWSYQAQGLLDITHIRFFTLFEMRRMFEETGYRAEKFGAILSRVLNDTYQKYRDKDPATLQVGRLTLTGISAPELLELCTEQFLFRCRPVQASTRTR